MRSHISRKGKTSRWSHSRQKCEKLPQEVLGFSSAQLSRSVVSDSCATPWVAARQASLSITSSRSSLKPMPIESVMPSSHLILCCPLLLLPPIPPSIRVFSNESTLHMRWPKYWSFSLGYKVINKSNCIFVFYHQKLRK